MGDSTFETVCENGVRVSADGAEAAGGADPGMAGGGGGATGATGTGGGASRLVGTVYVKRFHYDDRFHSRVFTALIWKGLGNWERSSRMRVSA